MFVLHTFMIITRKCRDLPRYFCLNASRPLSIERLYLSLYKGVSGALCQPGSVNHVNNKLGHVQTIDLF